MNSSKCLSITAPLLEGKPREDKLYPYMGYPHFVPLQYTVGILDIPHMRRLVANKVNTVDVMNCISLGQF